MFNCNLADERNELWLHFSSVDSSFNLLQASCSPHSHFFVPELLWPSGSLYYFSFLGDCGNKTFRTVRTRRPTSQLPTCPVSIPVRSWHCCIIPFRGSIEQKSSSEQCNCRQQPLPRSGCLALALRCAPTHPTGANYRISLSEQWRDRVTWKMLDIRTPCCKIYWDNWDTTGREVHQFLLRWLNGFGVALRLRYITKNTTLGEHSMGQRQRCGWGEKKRRQSSSLRCG